MIGYTAHQFYSTLIFDAESFCETRKAKDGYKKISKRNHRRLAAKIFAIQQTFDMAGSWHPADYPTEDHRARLKSLKFTFSKFVPKEGA